MPKHPHIIVSTPGTALGYTSPPGRGPAFSRPARSRQAHAQKLKIEITKASIEVDDRVQASGAFLRDICLEIVGEPSYELKVDSLEDTRLGVRVRSVQNIDGRSHATISIPSDKLDNFIKKIDRYATEENQRGGRPKNQDLIESISEIKPASLSSFWTDTPELYPQSKSESIWWEVWLALDSQNETDQVFADFVATLGDSSLRLSPHCIKFPERLVFLAFGSANMWMQKFSQIKSRLAELRRAKELPTDFVKLSFSDQQSFVENLANRIVPPNESAPAVCLLDYGLHVAHPLLLQFISEIDAHSINSNWETVDGVEAHGTEMAGIISFGEGLPSYLSNDDKISIGHRMESVRILRSNQKHPEEAWGYITQYGVSIAEVAAPNRRRLVCLPVTADDQGRDNGAPSSWSAAIDEHSSGQLDDVRRLYIVPTGNVRDVISNLDYRYPETNLNFSKIEDPGQSWNGLTVGAFTNNISIQSEGFEGYQPLAPFGGLCPASRTSCSWGDRSWPIKPDIVMEGGNYALSPLGQVDGCDDLGLLTTTMNQTGRLLTWFCDTSASTALAARSAAMLMADYPELWPETIRGLLVHSAEWTPQMLTQISGSSQSEIHSRLRCFGYGVPNLDRARYTIDNCVSLVHEGEIQPFKLDGSSAKTNHFVTHRLPWPVEALRALHDQTVTVRITLSYFIEPSPAGRGWGKKFRYASHGLRFALRGPTETDQEFRDRISTNEWEEEERPTTRDPIDWSIGSRLRTRGSVHSDWWSSSGAEVASCGEIAVYPITGWWRERKHLGFVEKITRYSLIVTIGTESNTIDLYTPIAQEVGLLTEIVS